MNTDNAKKLSNVEYTSSFFGLVRGLMFKKDGALLMDFGRECKPAIWMLFMRFPIDIVFIDGCGKVVDIVYYARPLSFNLETWRIYSPKKRCRYVLEVRSGTAKNLGIGKGTILKWTDV